MQLFRYITRNPGKVKDLSNSDGGAGSKYIMGDPVAQGPFDPKDFTLCSALLAFRVIDEWNVLSLCKYGQISNSSQEQLVDLWLHSVFLYMVG